MGFNKFQHPQRLRIHLEKTIFADDITRPIVELFACRTRQNVH